MADAETEALGTGLGGASCHSTNPGGHAGSALRFGAGARVGARLLITESKHITPTPKATAASVTARKRNGGDTGFKP